MAQVRLTAHPQVLDQQWRRRPRNHRDRQAGGRAGLPFLTTAAEDKGVAALEPYHGLAGRGVLNEDLVDLLLRGGGASRDLCDVNDCGLGPGVLQGRKCAGRSHTITSASLIASSPATVSRPGSPGPPPTKITVPTPVGVFIVTGDGETAGTP
jgi:hypothetical protein